MDTDDVKRSNELAENEDLDILWSALYLALEADLCLVVGGLRILVLCLILFRIKLDG